MFLEQLGRELEKGKGNAPVNYFVPRQWMPCGYKGRASFDGVRFKVNPYEFFSSLLEVESGEEEGKPSMSSNSLYVSLPISNAAYNHKGFGSFEPDDVLGLRESGTFLKMLAVAVHAKSMHFDTMYLLPVSTHSNRFKKGSIGSPYAVSDPLRISEDLADPLVDMSAEDLFGAFVEFCHRIGMKVVVDFVPRTAARDSALILEHPDWFYWIDVSSLSTYGPPKAPEMGFRQLSNEDMAYLYQKEDVRAFLTSFRLSPSITIP
jgi:hypothetical protein